MEDHAEGFMGSLEAVIITYIHILLARAQSYGPTELQESPGKCSLSVYLREKQPSLVEYLTLSLSPMSYSAQL